jgi:hypothetical protein
LGEGGPQAVVALSACTRKKQTKADDYLAFAFDLLPIQGVI